MSLETVYLRPLDVRSGIQSLIYSMAGANDQSVKQIERRLIKLPSHPETCTRTPQSILQD